VYNGEKYLRECIESALTQDCEVIIVDDGSTDGTYKIIKEFDYIPHIYQDNRGTASALNLGIKYASKDWIHWLSADDVLYSNTVEFMLKFCTSKDKIYYTNYDIIDENSNIIGEFIEPIERNNRTKEERFVELLGNYYGNGSSTMIHKDVFRHIGGFNESLKHSEDYDFMLKAMSHGYDMHLIPYKTLMYRRHPDQLSNKVGGSLNEFIRSKYR